MSKQQNDKSEIYVVWNIVNT